MKNEAIPRLRFRGFNNEWNYTTIGQQANIVRGASPRPIKDPKWFDKKSDVGWLRISDVTSQNGRLHFIRQRISKLGEAKTRVLTTPHLILSIAATVGEPAINYVKTGVHDGFLIFNAPKFNLEYMFQWLLQFKPKWRKYGQPGSQVNLNSSIVSSQKIYIPSLQEQQVIGKFFAKLDKLIQLQQKKVSLLKKLKRGYLQKLFPRKGELVPRLRFKGFHDKWKLSTFKSILNYEQPTKYRVKNTHYSSSGIPVLTANKAFILGYTHEKRIYNKGNCIIFDDFTLDNKFVNFPFMIKSSAIKILTSKNSNLYFDYELLNVVHLIHEGHKRHYISMVQNFKVLIPSLYEQNKIGNFFDDMDSHISSQLNKLTHLRKLKKAYLQKMFC